MTDKVILVCTLVLAGVYFYATEQLPSLEIGDPLGPKAFPRLLGVGLLIAAVVLLFEIVRGRKTAPASDMPKGEMGNRTTYLIVTAVSVWTFIYFFAFERLGYIIASTIYLLVLMSCFHRGKHLSNVLTAVLFSLGSYLMFTKLLGVNLARGILPF